jgi:hypothetical protein
LIQQLLFPVIKLLIAQSSETIEIILFDPIGQKSSKAQRKIKVDAGTYEKGQYFFI